MSEDSRLTRLTAICSSFPESERKNQGDHASFLVRKKVFAYYLQNHHGDGIVSACAKTLPGDNTMLITADLRNSITPHTSGREAGSGCALTTAKSIGTK